MPGWAVAGSSTMSGGRPSMTSRSPLVSAQLDHRALDDLPLGLWQTEIDEALGVKVPCEIRDG